MGRTLNIVERAYHATLEEQDDVALWFTLAVRVQGNADVDVLLRGTAVNYLVKTQDASGIAVGDIPLNPPPKIVEDIAAMQGKGIRFFAVEEDVLLRAIDRNNLVAGVELLKKAQLPALLGQYERVWTW